MSTINRKSKFEYLKQVWIFPHGRLFEQIFITGKLHRIILLIFHSPQEHVILKHYHASRYHIIQTILVSIRVKDRIQNAKQNSKASRKPNKNHGRTPRGKKALQRENCCSCAQRKQAKKAPQAKNNKTRKEYTIGHATANHAAAAFLFSSKCIKEWERYERSAHERNTTLLRLWNWRRQRRGACLVYVRLYPSSHLSPAVI